MKIEHNGLVLDGVLEEGFWTFNLETVGDDELYLMPSVDCNGRTNFSEIQLEYGDKRTTFEIPTITEETASGIIKELGDLVHLVTDEETGLSTKVFQIGGAWAVQNLNSENDIISQINLIEDMARIQARFIHLNGTSLIDDAIIESGHIKSLTADKIAAGTITGINVEGSTFRTIGLGDFSLELSNGRMRFFSGNKRVGDIGASLGGNFQPNGTSIIQRYGYKFSLNTEAENDSGYSLPVIEIPETSSLESPKLKIHAPGGLQIVSDTLSVFNGLVRTKVPFQAIEGYKASHGEASIFERAGDVVLWLDESSVGGVPIHRIAPRKKDGTLLDSGLGFYEDGRVAVVVNGVWKQL